MQVNLALHLLKIYFDYIKHGLCNSSCKHVFLKKIKVKLSYWIESSLIFDSVYSWLPVMEYVSNINFRSFLLIWRWHFVSVKGFEFLPLLGIHGYWAASVSQGHFSVTRDTCLLRTSPRTSDFLHLLQSVR